MITRQREAIADITPSSPRVFASRRRYRRPGEPRHVIRRWAWVPRRRSEVGGVPTTGTDTRRDTSVASTGSLTGASRRESNPLQDEGFAAAGTAHSDLWRAICQRRLAAQCPLATTLGTELSSRGKPNRRFSRTEWCTVRKQEWPARHSRV